MNCCGGHLEFPTENKTNFVKENHMTLHVVWSSISLLISEKMVFKILFHKNQCKAVSHYNSHLGFPTDKKTTQNSEEDKQGTFLPSNNSLNTLFSKRSLKINCNS